MIALPGMYRHFLKRAGWYAATFIVAVSLVFLLPRLGPVSYTDILKANMTFGPMTAEQREELISAYMKEHDLDKPLWIQFRSYALRILKGDLGKSLNFNAKPCAAMIGEKIPWTLGLIIPAVALAWIIGNLLGALAAFRRGIFDKGIYRTSVFIGSVPFFCFGLLLMYLFYSLFPVVDSLGGYSPDIIDKGWNSRFLPSVLSHYWVPFLSIFLVLIGGQAAGMRSTTIYELESDSMKYAETLGIRRSKVFFYCLRNALLPQLSGLAITIGTMVGGSLITEIIFAYPGLGTLLFDSIKSRDYPLIQAVSLVVTVATLCLCFAVEIISAFVDPRIKASFENDGGAYASN